MILWSYSSDGKLENRSLDVNNDGIADEVETYTYDNNGNLLTISIDYDNNGVIEVLKTYTWEKNCDR